MLKVSIVIPVYNNFEVTKRCIDSINNLKFKTNYEIIIADDGSVDETQNIEKYYNNVKLVKTSKNAGFLLNVQNAIPYAKGTYILLMNNDMIVKPKFLDYLYNTISKDKEIGVVGAMMLNEDGTIQEVGATVFADGTTEWNCYRWEKVDTSKTYEVDYSSGCGIMFLKEDWNKLGGFDEDYKTAYYEDVDLCYKIKYNLGKKIICQPKAQIYHLWGKTYSENPKRDNLISYNKTVFLKKWGDKLYKQMDSKKENYINTSSFSIYNEDSHKVITILGIKFKFKSKKHMKEQSISCNSFLENIFSVKNKDIYKIITILGIKVKFKSKQLQIRIEEEKRKRKEENLFRRRLNELLKISDNKIIIAYFDHGLAGGSETYFFDQLCRLPDNSVLLRIQYFLYNKLYKMTMYGNDDTYEVNNVDFTLLSRLINKLKFNKIILNNIVSYPKVKDILDLISDCKRNFVSAEVIVKGHDFYSICPEWNLLNYNNEYCGIRFEDSECCKCFYKFHLKCKDIRKSFSITNWRKMWGEFFQDTVDILEVFSPSSKDIFLKVYPTLNNKIVLKPHNVKPFPKYNIGIMGHFCFHKGSKVIENLVKYFIKKEIYDYQFVLYGINHSDFHSDFLTETGEYCRNSLPDILKQNNIDMIFIASICPETFSYTTAEAITLGYPVACFNLGGQADQVRRYDKGLILSSFESEVIEKEIRGFLERIKEHNNEII